MRALCCSSQQSLPPIDGFGSGATFPTRFGHVALASNNDRTADSPNCSNGPLPDLCRAAKLHRYSITSSPSSVNVVEGNPPVERRKDFGEVAHLLHAMLVQPPRKLRIEVLRAH